MLYTKETIDICLSLSPKFELWEYKAILSYKLELLLPLYLKECELCSTFDNLNVFLCICQDKICNRIRVAIKNPNIPPHKIAYDFCSPLSSFIAKL